MGYRGKVVEQQRARELRAHGWTYAEICAEVGVSRASVSLWVRDVEIDEGAWAERVRTNRNFGARHRKPNRLAMAKQAQISDLDAGGIDRVGLLSEREFLITGIALYAGAGSKTDGSVRFANSDPRMLPCSAPGCGGSSTSMSRGCASGSTFTKGSISMRLSPSGLRSRTSP